MTPQGSQLVDAGNQLLAQVPSRLDAGTINEAGKLPKAVLTIRTATTTLTVVLDLDDLKVWADIITRLADSLGNTPKRHLEPATILDVVRLGNNGKGA